jgi:four helix bundle protein
MINKTQSFQELDAWKAAHLFVLEVYKFSEQFPKGEVFGLVSQFRRASVSIAANIAEGYKRKSKVEKLRFYNISQSSMEECQYYIILSRDLKYINQEKSDKLDELIETARKLLNSYCSAISNSLKQQ